MPIQDDQIPPGQPIPVRSIANVDVAQDSSGSNVLIERAGEMYRVPIANFAGGGGGGGGTTLRNEDFI